jgi:hypothetical protein
VPLEFLRRKGGSRSAEPVAGSAPQLPSHSTPLPEEVVAQDHQLRLTYAGKTSEGVRLRGGTQAMAELPGMIGSLALSDIEVVDARDPDLGHASPSIVRSGEAAQWLQAHGMNSAVTRHALYVLESLDAIDPAFDTFACALLDGTVDPAGYPDYSSIVGGVVAHWDESTGDLIVRGVVGWGGRGTRGDTDRVATRILSSLLGNILESTSALGLTAVDRPAIGTGSSGVTCGHCGFHSGSGRAVYCPKCGMRLLHA